MASPGEGLRPGSGLGLVLLVVPDHFLDDETEELLGEFGV
jgi:hypothetical protein